MEMVNGYVFLDLTKSNVYSKALKVLGTDKPVVIKDGSGSPYFVDSLTLSGTSVVITKGGKTITIANDNTITNVGDIQPLMENIIDNEGNKRFIEINGEYDEITGVSISYCKASLSGTHLMLVTAGTIANGTAVSGFPLIGNFELPDYIMDRIVPLYSTNVDVKTINLFSSGGSSQSVNGILYKDGSNLKIAIGNITLTDDRNFRVQFDLLIDADYSE